MGRSKLRVKVDKPILQQEGRRTDMARYSKGAQKTVKQAMHKRKKGTLINGSGRKVKSRKQAIAIGLSEARRKGKKVPSKTSSS
jgi:uncharacterized protein DUF6496